MNKAGFGFLAAVLAASLSGMATAQNPSAPASTGVGRLQKVLGLKSLQANVVMTVTGGQQTQSMEFVMMLSKGNSRVEMDLAKMRASAGAGGPPMPPGMEKMVNISRPDKKVMYIIYPGMNAYVETALPEDAGETAAAPKVERHVEGQEKVEGYECDKVRNIVAAPDGTKTEFWTWEAKALHGMPVKMESRTPDGTMTMLFKNIKTEAPAASVFEPPAGATKHDSVQAMIMSGMMKMMPVR